MRKGLTLIEIVIVVALIAVITGVYFLIANPAGQLSLSRNTKRTTDLQSIMLGIRQNIADGGMGQFVCPAGPVPTTTKIMASASGSYNIASCITSIISVMPIDPSATSSYYNSQSDYNSGYAIMMSSSTGQITISAPNAELKKTISVTR